MPAPGDSIGRYRIVEALFAGFLAADPQLDRRVVLRPVPQGSAASARARAQVQHPNVIAVYDVIEHGDETYIATELVDGGTLAAWLTARRRGWREIADAFEQAGQGLVAAHAVGLVHGRFGPEHVIVAADRRARVDGFAGVDASVADDVRAFCDALASALATCRRVPARVTKAVQRERSSNGSSLSALLAELAPEPASPHRAIAGLGAIAIVASALSIWHVRQSRELPPCPSPAPLLAETWGPAQRARVGSAFDRLAEPWTKSTRRTVEEALDSYTKRWTAMQHENCEATRVRHEQSSLVFDLRSECLSRRRDELHAVIDVLAEGDAQTVERAVSIVNGLPPLDDCADVTALTAPVPPPTSRGARAAVDELRKELARGRALVDAAKFADASKVASSVVERARSLAYRPLEAEALLDLSNAQERAGEYRPAITAGQDAARAAEAGRHELVEARALVALVWLTGAREHEYERAHDLAVQARAAIERLDKPAALEADLARSLGATYLNEGRLEDALAEETRDLAMVERSDGTSAPTVGGILVEIGEIYREQGRYPDALQVYGRALAIFEKAWGSEHPTVAVPLNNMGLVNHRLGRETEALDYHRRALAIFERALGPNHPHVAEARTNIGVVLLAQGKSDAAYAEFEQARAIDTANSGPTSADVAIDLVNMADARRAANRLREALDVGRQAIDVARATVGDDDPIVADAYLTLARTLAASRAHRKAIDAIKHALAIWQRPGAELDAGAGEALTVLGTSQLALGDRAGATASARQAITLLEKSSRDSSALPAARALLAHASGSRR